MDSRRAMGAFDSLCLSHPPGHEEELVVTTSADDITPTSRQQSFRGRSLEGADFSRADVRGRTSRTQIYDRRAFATPESGQCHGSKQRFLQWPLLPRWELVY